MSIAKKPYIFVIFQGGPDPLSHLWIRACAVVVPTTGTQNMCAESECDITCIRDIGHDNRHLEQTAVYNNSTMICWVCTGICNIKGRMLLAQSPFL